MKNCKVNGCDSLCKLKSDGTAGLYGLCHKHYQRYKTHGNPLICLREKKSNNTKHPLYCTYTSMKSRVIYNTCNSYKNYGGRGIYICDRWLGRYGFDNFISDMGDRPEGHSLDRINNDGPYSPENCKWSTIYEQSANKRNNDKVVGVYYIKTTNKYRASIDINKKTIFLGYFNTIEEAAEKRKLAEYKYNIYK